MMIEYDIDNYTVAFLGVTTYLLGYVFGSPFVAPLSEMHGRRPVLLISIILFTIFVIPTAVPSITFAGVLVVRFISAVFGSVMLTNSPGSIGDIASEEYRALLLSIWTIGQACGPTVRLLHCSRSRARTEIW